MNIRILSKQSGRIRHRGLLAFTMIEIAISLGVIGFALVAIVGILPYGMNVQKDNREETIINQDGAYFMEAIRGGMAGLDELTNHVDYIEVNIVNIVTKQTNRTVYVNQPPKRGSLGETNYGMTNGSVIVRLLSMPKITGNFSNVVFSNTITAGVRALSGSALEQGGSNQFTAFRYQLSPEVVRFNSISYDSTNFLYFLSNTNSADYIDRSNRWEQVSRLTNNLFEVRLRFGWPVLPNGTVRSNAHSQVFRTLVSARQNQGFFEPQSYAK